MMLVPMPAELDADEADQAGDRDGVAARAGGDGVFLVGGLSAVDGEVCVIAGSVAAGPHPVSSTSNSNRSPTARITPQSMQHRPGTGGAAETHNAPTLPGSDGLMAATASHGAVRPTVVRLVHPMKQASRCGPGSGYGLLACPLASAGLITHRTTSGSAPRGTRGSRSHRTPRRQAADPPPSDHRTPPTTAELHTLGRKSAAASPVNDPLVGIGC